MRQRRPVDPLGAQNVDVILLHELIRGEGFGRAEHHMPGVVDDDVQTVRIGEDRGDAGLRGSVGLNVELDGAKIRLLFGRPAGESSDLGGVTPPRLTHGSVDGVTRQSEELGGHQAEARRGAGDEDDLLGHDDVPLMCLN